MSAPDSWPRRAPERVGAYRVLGLLGEGSAGVVYRAEHEETGAKVALKLVRLRREELLLASRREIAALGQLRHPGIVRILEDGVSAGVPWYAMELLSGRTLAQVLRELWAGVAPRDRRPAANGQLGPMIDLVQKLCEPLALLHGEGMVHRDLKPANVFVRDDGTPVLMDFGLVGRFAGALGREVIDDGGSGGGTPSHGAPEQIRDLAVDARTDLYALGCVLYEMVTGRGPFLGSSRVVMAGHLRDAPRPPSQLVDSVPADLESVLLRLLAKDPRDRPGYADDLRELLAPFGTAPAPPHGCGRAYVYRPTLSGRDGLLRQLIQGLAALTGAPGRGGCVLLGAESGMGKTYLALEVARAAAQREICVVAGGGLARAVGGTGGAALGPLVPLLHSISAYCLEKGPAAIERVLGDRARLLAVVAPELLRLPGQDALPEPPEVPPEAARDRLLRGLTDTLIAYARERPLLLLLDDLQWADEVSLHFLTFLPPDFFETRRILLLGTYRTDEVSDGLRALLDRPYVQSLPVERLGEDAVRSLVGDMLALPAPPAPFVRFLSERSAGNPFFVAEYLRTAVAEGLLRRSAAAGWHLQGGGSSEGLAAYEALPLPGSLRELIGLRLAGLTAKAQALVEVAAVLGREFEGGVLESIARLAGADPGATRELLSRQVLDEPEGSRLRFIHDKMVEVAYDRLAPDRRRSLHRAAAEVLAQGDFVPPALYPALVRHFSQGEVPEQTFRYLEKAGVWSLETGAYADAKSYLGRALAVDDKHGFTGRASPLSRARLTRQYGEAIWAAGDLGSTYEQMGQALALLGHPLPGTPVGWTVDTLRQALLQLLHLILPDRWLQASPERLAALLEAASALRVMIVAYVSANEQLKMLNICLRAANVKDHGHARTPKGVEYATLGAITGFLGLGPLSRMYFRRAERSIGQTGDANDQMMMALAKGTYHQGQAQWAEALHCSAMARDLSRAIGNQYFVIAAGLSHLVTLWMRGSVEDGLREAREIYEEGRTYGQELSVVWSEMAMGFCLIRLNRMTEARERLKDARERIVPLKDIVNQASCDGLLALVHLELGDLDLARRTADEAQTDQARAITNSYGAFGAHMSIPAVYLACWRRAQAARDPNVRQIAAQALSACAAARRFGRIYPIGRSMALRHWAQAQLLLGRPGRAAALLRRSIHEAKKLQMPYEEALAHRDLAALLPAGSDEATRHREQAGTLLERIGWRPSRMGL